MGSNVNGSADAELSRLAGSSTGGPFPAMDSVYFGSTNQVANAFGGTLAVNESSPVSGLKTIVFQVQIGEALGYDFVSPSGVPVLKINNTTNRVAATYPRYLVARFQNGTFPSPETGLDEPVYVNTWAYQWNLTNATPVSSFQIEFSAVTHAQVYALRLDQASVLQNYRLLVEPPPVTNSAAPPLQLASSGSPVFNGSQTTLTHSFRSDSNRIIDLEYTTNPTATTWTRVASVATGTGDFSVTLTNAGDARAEWGQRMFFRLRLAQTP